MVTEPSDVPRPALIPSRVGVWASVNTEQTVDQIKSVRRSLVERSRGGKEGTRAGWCRRAEGVAKEAERRDSGRAGAGPARVVEI